MKKKLLLFTTCCLTALFSFGQVPTSERDALIAFYNATDGANWTDNTSWNTADPVSTWSGVTVEIVAGQDHVTGLVMSNNNLNGTLPLEIGDLLEIREIDLSFHPLLTGSIPATIGNLTFLEALSFWDNNLTGTIPPEMGNLTTLEVLSLEDNLLTGNIPTEFSNLTSMVSFWINGNYFSGDIPDIFSNWTDLFFFSIGNSNLTPGPSNNFTGDLDLSNNTALSLCWVDHTLISSLNIQNGNNSSITNFWYYAIETPNLTCVFVDDVAFSNTTWEETDPGSTFVANVAACEALSISKDTLAQYMSLYPNPTSGILNMKNNSNTTIENVTIINTIGQKVMETQIGNKIDISSLTEGMYFVNVKTLNGEITTFKILKK
ncbi:T9SS type A sorting domain-containing protein [Bizionia arctica]|nr:T9SS type A sorting domain-containing protein [Bizionia arctica]